LLANTNTNNSHPSIELSDKEKQLLNIPTVRKKDIALSRMKVKTTTRTSRIVSKINYSASNQNGTGANNDRTGILGGRDGTRSGRDGGSKASRRKSAAKSRRLGCGTNNDDLIPTDEYVVGSFDEYDDESS
jgi:hypothetical protein